MHKIIEANLDNVLRYGFIPSLGEIISGKVRDCHFKKDLMYMIASDRISCFDVILNQCIPYKGQVLNEISRYFFRNISVNNTEKIEHVVKNALPVKNSIDPNLMLVEGCTPIKIELVVRNYLTGSMWRAYKEGRRKFSGMKFKNGLKQNQQLEELFINPTSKAEEGHDEEINEKQCLEIISKQFNLKKDEAGELYEKIKKQSIAIFQSGMQLASSGKLLLVDTKYEFGMTKDGRLVLIDEIHTPDSSRYWLKKDYEKGKPEEWSKEFVRQYLISQGFMGDGKIPDLSKEVIIETSKRYIDIYERLVGKFEFNEYPIQQRLIHNLKKTGHTKGMLAVIIMGSFNDISHCCSLKTELKKYDIPVEMRVASAHRTPAYVEKLINYYNKSIEPLVMIGVAGGTDALSGALAARSNNLVISCPPYSSSPKEVKKALEMCLGNPKGSSNVLTPKRENVAKATAQHFSQYDSKLSEKLVKEVKDKEKDILEKDKFVKEED